MEFGADMFEGAEQCTITGADGIANICINCRINGVSDSHADNDTYFRTKHRSAVTKPITCANGSAHCTAHTDPYRAAHCGTP